MLTIITFIVAFILITAVVRGDFDGRWLQDVGRERCAYCGRWAEQGRSYCEDHDSTDWEPWKDNDGS